MACDTWRRMIIDRLADELGEEDAVGLEQHLAECAACLKESEKLRTLFAAATRPAGWRADSAMEEKLLGAMRTNRDRPPARDTRRRWTALLRLPLPSYAAVALIVVAVAIGFWAGRSDRRPVAASLAGESAPGARIEQPGGRPEESLLDTDFAFVAVRSDAVGIPSSAIPDSL